MTLPIFKGDSAEMGLMQTRWAEQLNPVIANPIANGILLEGVALASGANTVNHKLGRKLRGWILTRVRANATVYDMQDTNTMPTLTLSLVASGAVTVDLYVF